MKSRAVRAIALLACAGLLAAPAGDAWAKTRPVGSKPAKSSTPSRPASTPAPPPSLAMDWHAWQPGGLASDWVLIPTAGTTAGYSSCTPVRWGVDLTSLGSYTLEERQRQLSVITDAFAQAEAATDYEFERVEVPDGAGKSPWRGAVDGVDLFLSYHWPVSDAADAAKSAYATDKVSSQVWGRGGPVLLAQRGTDSWIHASRVWLHVGAARRLSEPLLRNLVAHEIGHALGLDHVNADEQAMAPDMRGTPFYGSGDLGALQQLAQRPCRP